MVPNDQSSFPEETAQRDAAWVQAVMAGDSEIFGQLVEAYQKRALATAYRLLGNSHDAAEVVQEALIRAYRSLGHLKEPGRFGPWLMRIVSNLSLNARRSRHARRADSTVTLDEQWGNDSTASGNDRTLVSSFGPEREAEGRELQAAMDAALEKLPEKQRLALLLFTVDGLPQKEIAEILECSLEAVKWNVFQARKRLREELSELLESK